MTYFPLYLWLRTLLLYSFFKKLTWFINMYLTHHFRNWSLIYLTFTQTTIFILCVIPSASYITSPSLKIKIWNQCMQNESWLWKDCEVINGFSKKYTYDLDWKFSILKKKFVVTFLALLTSVAIKSQTIKTPNEYVHCSSC